MKEKQINQFNAMLKALRTIAKGYQTPAQLRRNSKNQFGLNYQECLEMSYENIQQDAASAIKGIKELNNDK